METETFDIAGLAVFTPARHGDARGWFSESWSAARMAAAGFDLAFVQDNHAYTAEPGTLRGLHLQTAPCAQAKLVRCTAGRVFDVAVDVRPGSPTRGRWRGVELSAENGRQLLAPRGFLHGYLTLSPHAEVQYKVDAPYAPDCDVAVAWDDPDIGVAWPLAEAGVAAPILSAKDAAAPRLRDLQARLSFDAGEMRP